MRLVLILFSIWVWTASFLIMTLASLLVIPVRWILGARQVIQVLVKPTLRACIRLALVRVEITCSPGFDPTRTSMFCQNHVNLMDGHLSARVIPAPYVGLMLAWHFKIPGYGWLLGLAGSIAVLVDRRRRLPDLIVQAKERASRGLSLLVFPEGHRTLTGQVGKFRKGVFVMAREAGLPVVPVAVRGWYEVNRKGSKLFRPLRTVQVYVGAQVETAALTDSEIGPLAKRLQALVSDYVEHGRLPDEGDDACLSGTSTPP